MVVSSGERVRFGAYSAPQCGRMKPHGNGGGGSEPVHGKAMVAVDDHPAATVGEQLEG